MSSLRDSCNSLCSVAAACLVFSAAYGHSASNAYLTITARENEAALHVQWDVALRDLEFVMGIDRNGDGKLTWGELRERRDDVARYLYSHIAFSAAAVACRVEPGSLQVDEHSDGAYAVALFDVQCGSHKPPILTLDYKLFFDVDPSHRGILVLRNRDAVSSALLSPDHARVQLML